MNRPNLILRRHGPMTFGLGYFQDGVWVDHLVADHDGARALAVERPAQHDASPIDVVHQWFSCCADAADVESLSEDRDSSGPAMGIALQTVAGTAPR
jgi:hypothetical protein